jgi:hypothetical protein
MENASIKATLQKITRLYYHIKLKHSGANEHNANKVQVKRCLAETMYAFGGQQHGVVLGKSVHAHCTMHS